MVGCPRQQSLAITMAYGLVTWDQAWSRQVLFTPCTCFYGWRAGARGIGALFLGYALTFLQKRKRVMSKPFNNP
jgi:hypothetical protein